jgi:hypothetical protein
MLEKNEEHQKPKFIIVAILILVVICLVLLTIGLFQSRMGAIIILTIVCIGLLAVIIWLVANNIKLRKELAAYKKEVSAELEENQEKEDIKKE